MKFCTCMIKLGKLMATLLECKILLILLMIVNYLSWSHLDYLILGSIREKIPHPFLKS